MSLYYIPFADTTQFYGVTVVEGDDEVSALANATAKGLNPGGEAAIWVVPPDLAQQDLLEMISYKDRLISREELEFHGNKSLKQLSKEEGQYAMGKADAIVCADCNSGKPHRH